MGHRQLQASPTVHVQASIDNAFMTAAYTFYQQIHSLFCHNKY